MKADRNTRANHAEDNPGCARHDPNPRPTARREITARPEGGQKHRCTGGHSAAIGGKCVALPVGVDVLQEDLEDREPHVRDDHLLLVALPHAGREHRSKVLTARCKESLRETKKKRWHVIVEGR